MDMICSYVVSGFSLGAYAVAVRVPQTLPRTVNFFEASVRFHKNIFIFQTGVAIGLPSHALAR